MELERSCCKKYNTQACRSLALCTVRREARSVRKCIHPSMESNYHPLVPWKLIAPLEVHSRANSSPTLAPIVSHINPAQAPPTLFFTVIYLYLYIYTYKNGCLCICPGITLERLERFRPNLVHILLYVCIKILCIYYIYIYYLLSIIFSREDGVGSPCDQPPPTGCQSLPR
jgi:hypothetical protein